MKPHTCPTCQGYKTVPPRILGDIAKWTAGSLDKYPCPTCGATDIIWEVRSLSLPEGSTLKYYTYPPSEE